MKQRRTIHLILAATFGILAVGNLVRGPGGLIGVAIGLGYLAAAAGWLYLGVRGPERVKGDAGTTRRLPLLALAILAILATFVASGCYPPAEVMYGNPPMRVDNPPSGLAQQEWCIVGATATGAALVTTYFDWVQNGGEWGWREYALYGTVDGLGLAATTESCWQAFAAFGTWVLYWCGVDVRSFHTNDEAYIREFFSGAYLCDHSGAAIPAGQLLNPLN